MKSPKQITAQVLRLIRKLGETRGTAKKYRIKRVIRLHNRYLRNIMTYYGHDNKLSEEETNRPLPRRIYCIPRSQRAYSMTITPDEL